MYVVRSTLLRSYDAVSAPGDINGLTFILPPRVQELDLDIVASTSITSEAWNSLPDWRKYSPRLRIFSYSRRAFSPRRVKFKTKYWEKVVRRGRLSEDKILV